MEAGTEDDWSELFKNEGFIAWTRVKMQECFCQVRQEDDERKSIAQQILQKGTDFQRWIFAPVGGWGGVTLSYVCPHCQRVLIEGLHPVGFNEAREEAVQLVVRGMRRPVRLEGTRRKSWSYRTAWIPARRRCSGPTPSPKVQTKCAPSGSWQPISREVTVLCRC